MNWESIGAISELVGAAAVVVSLLYLAKQIKQNTVSTEAVGFQTWQSDSAAHWLAMADNRELGRDVAACMYDSRNLSDDSWIPVGSWLLNNLRQYQTTFILHEKGVIDDDLFAVEMRMAARNLSIPGIRQWWDAGGRNQMLPKFAQAVEAFDPGEGAHWAWTKETGFVSTDQVEDLSLDDSSTKA
jgi:hypothetical protein